MRALLFLVLINACDLPTKPGDTVPATGETGTGSGDAEYTGCDDTTSAVAADEVTALGFSANDVLTALTGPFSASAEWYDTHTTTTLSLAVSGDGDATFYDREVAVDTGSGGLGGGADPQCSDELEVPVAIAFSTADGGFDEHISSSVFATDLSSLSVGGDLDWTALGGSFTITSLDPSDWDTVTLSLEAVVAGGATTGEVRLSASKDTGGGSGMGQVGPVLLWPPP